MIPIELWRARIGQFNAKCHSGRTVVFFSFLFYPNSGSRRRKNDVSQENDPGPQTTTVSTASSPLSPADEVLSTDTLPDPDPPPLQAPLPRTTSRASSFSSSSYSSTLFSLLPSSYSSGVLQCRSVLREALIILLIAIISQQLLLSAGDVETNPGPIASDRPKHHELISIKKADGTKLEVTKWITSHEQWRCVDFANMLLKDDVLVRRYENEHKEKDEFVRMVLKNWLSRNDDDSTDSAVPRTWAALAECVTDAGLDGALTKAISDTCSLAATGVSSAVPPTTQPQSLAPTESAATGASSAAPPTTQPQSLAPTESAAAAVSISGGNESIIAAGGKGSVSAAGGKGSIVVTGGHYSKTVHHHYHRQSSDQLTVTTNQYNDEIDMPPTKKSQTFSPPNTTEVQTQHVTHSSHHSIPTSSADPTHSTPHPIATYQHYLKDLYSPEYPDYSKPEFTRHRPKQIVNLVLVHREDDESDKSQRECLLYQLHGNIDLIQQKKTPLTKDQITVLDSGATAHRVLIEGAPGIGKTTLLWQLCHQWADGELLQQWELVILVQLRDKTTRTAQCLSDLLYHPDDEISKAVCHIVERREGENVLLLFDGYDEISDDQQTDSIFLKILRQSRFLRKATVIVSSRPFATKSLPFQFRNNLDQHVEIVGFNEQDIETYLTSACQGNPDMLSDLKSYISTQPFISSVLYNPLHCTIVIELYRQYWQRGEKGFAPSTMTQLYSAFLLNILRRQLDSDIDSLSELPSDVCHQLHQLAKLAAEGIEQKRYIFQNVPNETLGLMHSVKSLHDIRDRPSTSYSFSHMTLQEFLAARYWSQLPPLQLTEVLQRQDLFPIGNYVIGEPADDDDYSDSEMEDENEDSDDEDEDGEEEETNTEDTEEEDSNEEEDSDEEDNIREEDNKEKDEEVSEEGYTEVEEKVEKDEKESDVEESEEVVDDTYENKITHWPVLLFIAGLTQLTHITRLITRWAGRVISSGDGVILAHPALCQLLFECQSPQLVSTVFSGRRVEPYFRKITSPLDWFVMGYCIAHCGTTSSWSVYIEDSLEGLQAFSSGLHYSSTSSTQCRIEKNGSLTELKILVENKPVSPYLEAFHLLYPYTQVITLLTLRGDLHSDDKGVPVLQQLSHYCPKIKSLALPTLHPPYMSLPHLPQHTLDTLDIKLPLMKDDSFLDKHLQQYQSLKRLILYGASKQKIPSSILYLLVGKINSLDLDRILCTCEKVLVNPLTSPHSSLRKLRLSDCTFSSGVYNRLMTTIATSKLTYFAVTHLDIVDVTRAKAIATLLVDSKTLEEVEVIEEPRINKDVAVILAEAMNHSSVKNLTIGFFSKGTTVLGSHYPTDRVKLKYW